MYDDTPHLLVSPLHDHHFLPAHGRVLVRVDGNVPLKNGTIVDDLRLRRLLPTLDAIMRRTQQVRILTHLGHPNGHDPELSTRPLQVWFLEHGYPVTVAENVRFDEREYHQSVAYAQELKGDAEYYINDAFGSIHRTDTSLATLAELFPPCARGIGLLMEEELRTLHTLQTRPARPVVMVLGGGKISKLAYLEQLCAYADALLLCPALSAHLSSAQVRSPKLHVPCDYLVSTSYPWQPPFHLVMAEHDADPRTVISAGPQTIAAWQSILAAAGTIIFNGPMGNLALRATTTELHKLLDIIAHATAYTVVGGGDSLQALAHFGLTSDIAYCCTGGGSMLAFLSNAPLPGLELLPKGTS